MRLSLAWEPNAVNSTSTLLPVYMSEFLTLLVSFTHGALWTNICLATAILCASLPTYRPLLVRLGNVGSSIRSRFGSPFTSRRPLANQRTDDAYTMGPMPQNYKRYNQLADPTGDRSYLRQTMAESGLRKASSVRDDEIDSNNIHVKNTVEVV